MSKVYSHIRCLCNGLYSPYDDIILESLKNLSFNIDPTSKDFDIIWTAVFQLLSRIETKYFDIYKSYILTLLLKCYKMDKICRYKYLCSFGKCLSKIWTALDFLRLNKLHMFLYSFLYELMSRPEFKTSSPSPWPILFCFSKRYYVPNSIILFYVESYTQILIENKFNRKLVNFIYFLSLHNKYDELKIVVELIGESKSFSNSILLFCQKYSSSCLFGSKITKILNEFSTLYI